MASISIVIYLVFTPERITPVVMKYANEYMNARLECESIELTFYSTFPNFGIRLRNGSIINIADSLPDCPQDTLLKFNSCSVSFNPVALYRKNHLIVNHIRLERPLIYAYSSPEGKTNWDILPQDDSTDSSRMKLPDVTVHGISITDADIVYDDRRQTLFVATDSLQLRAKGTLTDVSLSLKVKAVTAMYENQSYASLLPFSLRARLLSDSLYRRFELKKSVFSIGIMDFDLEGVLERDTVSGAKIDLGFNLHSSDLIKAIPGHILNNIGKKYTVPGIFDFSGRVNGYLGAGAYPACSVTMRLKDGAIIDNRFPEKSLLQKIEIDCNAEIDPTNAIPSYININSLYLQNAAAELNISGMLNNIFTQPSVDVKISSAIDFGRFMKYMPVDTAITAGGTVTADVSGNFLLNDLLAYNVGKVSLAGNIDVNDVRFNWREEGIDLFAPLAKISMGSNVTDSVRGRTISSLLRANVELDSLTFNWKDELSIRAGKLFTSLRTAEQRDSVSIVEMSVYSRLNDLHLRTPDSTRLRATKISALGKLSPLAGNPSKPEWTARISMDSIRGRTSDFAGKIDSAVTELKLHIRETRRQTGTLTQEDSIRRRRFMDSIVIANRNTSVVKFKLPDSEVKDFLTQWNITGSFAAKSAGIRTPYFPLRTKLNESALTFKDDKLLIKRTRLQTEGAHMTLNGEIEGIRRALLYNGRVKANIAMDVDSMDCNRIIRALAAGSAYSTVDREQRDSISSAVLDSPDVDMQDEPDDSVSGLFVVPRNIDMELKASMKNVKYNNFDIAQANGKIIVRNRSIRIPDLKIKSDIGNVNLSVAYKAPTSKGAHSGVDIHMEQVQIRELIRSIPVLDSLTPMMRSFEGLAECNIIAVAELDSLANLVIPETTALCHISGKNMVLLDGETFSAIAKKMYFKNKNRNVIDSISVDMMLNESTISVFPFVLSMDRYVAAVGGVQNLDLSFEYHITILKWPLPLIKIGLNLWGNPDDIHYRIASRRYENLLTPVKEKSLTSAVINVRRQLHDILRKSIDEILNESSETMYRQRPPVLNNDSIQSVLKLDTISISN
jgi:hypothetical protein